MTSLIYKYKAENGAESIFTSLTDAREAVAKNGGTYEKVYQNEIKQHNTFGRGVTAVTRSQYETMKAEG